MSQANAGRVGAIAEAIAPTRARYLIVGLLFATGVVNYLDRTNLAIAAPALRNELHIDAVTMGWIFSAFGWTYTAMQIPGGWLADRIHPRVLYPAAIVLWSVATLALGVSGGLLSVVILRLAVGVCESPTYIMNNRIVTTWFPERERASTIGIYTAAQFVGIGFLAPVLTAVTVEFGWRSVFLLTGALGVVVFLLWLFFYRDPAQFRRANAAEIELIRAGGGIPDLSNRITERKRVAWSDLGIILSRRKLWGIFIGQYGMTATQNFFLTWFPTYLVQYRHFDFIKAGFYEMLPFLAGFCGVLCSGFFSDFLLKRGMSLAVARKTPIIVGLLLSTVVVAANYTNSEGLVVFFLTLAFFANGLASITWSFVSALAPERLIGMTGGVFNFFGGLSGISIPPLIGYLVAGQDFSPALILVAALALVAAFCYVVLVGRVERVQE
jgi:MFS transporter, ACS family, D-galactonate transporter